MIEGDVLEFGNFAEHEYRNLSTEDARIIGIDLLDLQRVMIAGLAICHSHYDIHCGLSIVVADRAPETLAATDDLPVRLDRLQHELHQGPTVGPDSGEMVLIKDLGADNRWPDFGKLCVAVMNLRSMVSVQISVGSSDRARLNFYSTEPRAFDHLEVDALSGLARRATTLVRMLISEFREPLLQAKQTDGSRSAIAVATVMARYRVNSADAFDLLREASHDLQRALLGVSIDVVADGRLPEEAIIRAPRQGTAEGRLSPAMGAADAASNARTQPSGPQAAEGEPRITPKYQVAQSPDYPPGRSSPRGLVDAGGVHGAS